MTTLKALLRGFQCHLNKVSLIRCFQSQIISIMLFFISFTFSRNLALLKYLIQNWTGMKMDESLKVFCIYHLMTLGLSFCSNNVFKQSIKFTIPFVSVTSNQIHDVFLNEAQLKTDNEKKNFLA